MLEHCPTCVAREGSEGIRWLQTRGRNTDGTVRIGKLHGCYSWLAVDEYGREVPQVGLTEGRWKTLCGNNAPLDTSVPWLPVKNSQTCKPCWRAWTKTTFGDMDREEITQ